MGQPGVIHRFADKLAESESAKDEGFWDSVYRKAFPNLVSHMQCKGDFQSQRLGIDRLILLANGRVLRIDEKKRANTYPDVLLEYLSNDVTHAPGWIEKDLAIDFLAYAFMPSQKVFMFDWALLRRTWLINGEAWKAKYGTRTAQNQGYRTMSVPIPTRTLLTAITLAAVITLDAA